MLTKPSSCVGCPLSCAPFGSMMGFVPADGECTNGVLMVLEAAGENEAQAGRPVVGRAGQYLFQQLQRVGIEREQFRIHNVLSCQPPGNKLLKMPYTEDAIRHCAPNLERTIEETREHARRIGKTFTILTLGRFAFKRIMGYDDRHPIMREDYLCYPHWNEQYQAWVVAADHPSYLMKGNNHLAHVLQFAAQRAVEIANNGLVPCPEDYLLDPSPEEFAGFVKDYYDALRQDPEITLSYDIETPFKSGKSEEEVAKEDDDDYTILRCSFAFAKGRAASVPWYPEYMSLIEELFASSGDKMGWNSANYDDPRIMRHVDIKGARIDGMLAWHVLNSTLPKSLGFVTPFYNQQTTMWKHLSDSKPAYYNAKDADMALYCYLGIKDGLKQNRQWHVLERHVLQLNKVLSYMSGKGVLIDQQARHETDEKLTGMLNEVVGQMDEAVPQDARQLKVYKKAPKNTEGLVQVAGEATVKHCPRCLQQNVKADHFKSRGKKALAKGEPENACVGLKPEKIRISTTLWAKPLEFKISKTSLLRYQSIKGHKAVRDDEGKETFDVNAIKTLSKLYLDDPLYPLIGRHRKIQKLLSTYVRKVPIGKDGRVHTTYTHNPSTLRLASQNPNLQQLPRPGKPDDIQSLIRNMYVAAPGHILLARDYSGIEAVLVGYEARSAGYIRLAKMDVHTFYTMYALNQLGDGRVLSSELPQLSWEDEKLRKHLEHYKGLLKHDRNSLYKHLTHAINFGQGPKGAQAKIYKETEVLQPVETIAKVMAIYKELFPEIPRWHNDIRLQADRDGYLRNAFGYVHRFNRVFSYKKEHGKWKRVLGDDAEAVLAFKPQSNAAGIIKEAILRIYFNRFDEAGQYLRQQIHDEIFTESPENKVGEVDQVLQEEMERPIPELKLPASWNMGDALVVLTEPKRGYVWGKMK